MLEFLSLLLQDLVFLRFLFHYFLVGLFVLLQPFIFDLEFDVLLVLLLLLKLRCQLFVFSLQLLDLCLALSVLFGERLDEGVQPFYLLCLLVYLDVRHPFDERFMSNCYLSVLYISIQWSRRT